MSLSCYDWPETHPVDQTVLEPREPTSSSQCTTTSEINILRIYLKLGIVVQW